MSTDAHPSGGDRTARLAAELLIARPFTDYGMAERLVAEHGSDLRHVPGLGWLGYDGMRWKRDDDGDTMRRTKSTVRRLREIAARMPEDDKRREALWKFANQCEQRPRLEAAVALAQSEAAVQARVEELDADPFALNTISGTVNLRTGELRPHDRSDLITRMAPVNHDAAAACPTWLAFLDRVFDGDEELIDYVQRCVGYTLTGDTREQVLFVLHGSGANGKSVFVETIAALLGEHAASADAATFTSNRGAGIPNDLARLRGARLVRATETEEGTALARSLVKRVTGGDTVAARFLYGEFFEYHPAFKLWLVTNFLPAVPAEDRATWRRIRVVPFAVRIPHAEQDRQLPVKLRAELPGILKWAVEGAQAWQRDGLGLPRAVSDASGAYRTEQDSVARFLDTCCHQAPDATVSLGALRDAYDAFCRQERVTPVTARAWPTALAERGFVQRRSGPVGRYWVGLELAE